MSGEQDPSHQQEVHAESGSEISNVEQIIGDVYKTYNTHIPKWFIVSHGIGDIATLYLLWKDYKSQSELKDDARTSPSNPLGDPSIDLNNLSEKVDAYHRLSKTVNSSPNQTNKKDSLNTIDYAKIYKSNVRHLLSEHERLLPNQKLEADSNKLDIDDKKPTDEELENEIEAAAYFSNTGYAEPESSIPPDLTDNFNEADESINFDDEDEEGKQE